MMVVLDEDNLFKILDNVMDADVKNMLYLFRNIKCCEIVNIDMPMIKVRELNPLVVNKNRVFRLLER